MSEKIPSDIPEVIKLQESENKMKGNKISPILATTLAHAALFGRSTHMLKLSVSA